MARRASWLLIALLQLLASDAAVPGDFDGVYSLTLRVANNPCNTFLPVGTIGHGQLVVTTTSDGSLLVGVLVEYLGIPDVPGHIEPGGVIVATRNGNTIRVTRAHQGNAHTVQVVHASSRGNKTDGFTPCEIGYEGTAVRPAGSPSAAPFDWDTFFSKTGGQASGHALPTTSGSTPLGRSAPAAPQDPNPPRQLTVRLTVRGQDTINIRSGELWLHHESAMKHGFAHTVLINGKPCGLSWTGRDSAHCTLSPSLAPFDQPVTVEKTAGRGKLNVIEQPVPANSLTLRISITDNPVGDDEYEIKLRW